MGLTPLLVTVAVFGLEVNDVNPRDKAVHIRYKPSSDKGDSFIDVSGINKSGYLDCEIIDLEPGHLIVIGPPGTYQVSGIEEGERIRRFIQIVDKGPKPPPGPDDDDDKDDKPDPPKPDDDEEPDEWPETKYNVGPQISWAFKNAKSIDKVCKIFDKAGKDCEQVSQSVTTTALEVRKSLTDIKDEEVDKGYKVYKELFTQRRNSNQIVKIQDFEGAYKEVATWIRKRKEDK